MFLVTILTLSFTAFSQSPYKSEIKNEQSVVNDHETISNSIQVADNGANFDNYSALTTNSTAKLVNNYLNKQTPVGLPEFHSTQARVKYYVISGAFVGLLTLFIINLIKVNGN